MFLLGLLFFVAIVLGLGTIAVWILTKPLKDDYPTVALWLRGLGLAGILVFLTWPFLVGRWIFDFQCEHFAGLHLTKSVDARNNGIFDLRLSQQADIYAVSDNLFREDVADIARGRFAYLETPSMETPTLRNSSGLPPRSPRYQRFFLAPEVPNQCSPLDKDFRAILKTLSPGKCLASEHTDALQSRYEINVSGYAPTESSTTKIVDRSSGDTVGRFTSYRANKHPLQWFAGGGDRGKVCPDTSGVSISPHEVLSSLVFLDRNGSADTIEAIQERGRMK